MDGSKPIETRSYNPPSELFGERVYIIQSPAGKDGVSAMVNIIDFKKQQEDDKSIEIIGSCIFSSIKQYTAPQEFEEDKHDHLVSQSTGYGWKEGRPKPIAGPNIRNDES